ncbi:substrate-binding domain-containing protein [Cellulomonas sp. NPDC089187]|uniref:LacI family DNA-binding transcriptional regulator n=1 Tax=Cellulomonas sp. NPDC089187 TaxID=3154970 RepID=UPI00342EE95F
MTSDGDRLRFGLVLTDGPGDGPLTPFYRDLLAGVEEHLDPRGAAVLLVTAEDRAAELALYRRWARQHLVDAVVVTDLTDGDDRAAVCAREGLPVVLLGGDPAWGLPVVDDYDNGAAMRIAVEHLVELGHSRIGRVSGPERFLHSRARTASFTEATAAAGAVGTTVAGDYGAASGADATRTLLDLDQPPTAIVYDNDVMAVAGLVVAQERGMRVPDDLSLLAWDDSDQCRLADPALSVVSRDVHDLGAATAAVLLDTASGRSTTPGRSAQVRVVGRGSTGPAPRPRSGQTVPA